MFIARHTDLTVRVQTAARAPFVSLFSCVSTGGRERWSEGFLETKSIETHEDVRSTGGNTYHPQTDGQSEITVQSLEYLLWMCVLDHLGCWNEMLCLVEFMYNNGYHASIGMTPCEALYVLKIPHRLEMRTIHCI